MQHREYAFAVLFHPAYSLDKRKALYKKYASQFKIRFYNISSKFSYPLIYEKECVSENDLLKADGMLIEDPIN